MSPSPHQTGPWTAPGGQVIDEQGSISGLIGSSPRSYPSVASTESVPPEPVPLRPLTASDVLDGAIGVIKSAPRTVLTVAACVVVPLELVASWLQRDHLSESGLSGALSAATSTTSPAADITWTTLVLFVLSGIVLSVVAGAIAHLMSSWYADRNATAGDALNASFSRLPALVVAWLLVHAVEGIGLAGIVLGAVFLMPLFVVVAPVIVVEHLGPWRGLRRSMQLVRTRYSSVLGIAILVAVVDGLLTIALTGIGTLFSFFQWGWIVEAVCSAGSSLITVPFVAAAATLMYFDLRVRSEGLDLELGIATHFAGDR